MAGIGIDGTMLIFAAFSLVGGVLIQTTLPETKRKNVEEILTILEK
jgi:hypothetical protein